jgi:phosphoenolpyruvate carboxylase
MAFPRSKFYHVKAKLLETHGHDLVLLFRLPNLPRQDILRILLDLALNNLTISQSTATHYGFALHHFTRFLSRMTRLSCKNNF